MFNGNDNLMEIKMTFVKKKTSTVKNAETYNFPTLGVKALHDFKAAIEFMKNGGYVRRLSFNDVTNSYVMEKFLSFNPKTGEFKHAESVKAFLEGKWVANSTDINTFLKSRYLFVSKNENISVIRKTDGTPGIKGIDLITSSHKKTSYFICDAFSVSQYIFRIADGVVEYTDDDGFKNDLWQPSKMDVTSFISRMFFCVDVQKTSSNPEVVYL